MLNFMLDEQLKSEFVAIVDNDNRNYQNFYENFDENDYDGDIFYFHLEISQKLRNLLQNSIYPKNVKHYEISMHYETFDIAIIDKKENEILLIINANDFEICLMTDDTCHYVQYEISGNVIEISQLIYIKFLELCMI